ncbi:MAG: calcium-binding protein [Amaricoccus sp.]
MFAYHDGAEIWHVTGLHLDTRYATVGTTREEAYRKAFSGDDSMIGSREADKLIGYAGEDRLNGGGGADYLGGYSGNDTLHGQSGRDRLSGGSGRDILDGGTGNDRLTGGKDADVFVFAKASGHDVIVDFEPHDHIQIDSGASRFSQLDITKDGHDVLIAFAETEIRLLDTRLHSIDAHDFLF